MRYIRLMVVVAVALVGCADPDAPVGTQRLAPYLEPQGDLSTQLVPGEYIVVLNDDAGSAATAAAVSGAEVMAVWDVALRGYAVRATPEQLSAIRGDPRVRFVEPNGRMSVAVTQSPPPSWGLDRIDQAQLPLDNGYSHYPTAGTGVHAYIIDTGINHTHFEWGSKNARRTGNNFDVITPGGAATDCYGHGTHVAGTIGGDTYGVARGVTLHAVRVLGCDGRGTTSQVITGINWVTANRIMPAVANLSLGGAFSQAQNNAVTALVNSGVFTAVASGNSNVDACSTSPASTPSTPAPC